VPGSWAAFLGRVITLTIDRLGDNAGLPVFLIGVQDKRSTGISTLTVIRRL